MPPKRRTREEADEEPTMPTMHAKAAKATGKAGPVDNSALVNIFHEMSLYETRAGEETWAARAYENVSKALAGVKTQITCGADVAHLSGVGDKSVETIDEFLKTGKVAHLGKLKEEVGKLPAAVEAAEAATKESAPGATKLEPTPPSKAVLAKIAKAEEELEGMTVDQLKALLQLNDQIVSGSKSDLVQRAGHQMVMGAVPHCPLCKGGHLRYDIKTGEYQCPGFHDKVEDKPIPCSFTTHTIHRKPWRTA
jgi:hypothetical protein